MQSTARKNELPLDRMCLICDVTKKMIKDEFSSGPREGAYIHGLFMEVFLVVTSLTTSVSSSKELTEVEYVCFIFCRL